MSVEEFEQFIEDAYVGGRISKKERNGYLRAIHEQPVIEIRNVSMGIDGKPVVEIIYMPTE